jgi:hypothetical protein
VHDVRPGVGVGMSAAARACWVAEGWGICVRHGQEGGKRMHEEEEDERERGVPDLRVLACERRARMASRVGEAELVRVCKRERYLRCAGRCAR